MRVQGVVRDELQAAIDEFHAEGGAAVMMDANTGEVLAMVSLPDYDANDFGKADADARFNRAVSGAYEPGSTFKLQTAAMALDDGVIHIWDSFDTVHPIHIGRFTITDFEPAHHNFEVPEIIAYSSNIGASHIATLVGAERQRDWLKRLGFFVRSPIQLPESAPPIVQSAKSWQLATIMTVSFGNGIAVTPMQLMAGTDAIVDGGVYRPPTLLALPAGHHRARRAGNAAGDLRDHAQADAAGRHRRHRHACQGSRLSGGRQDRHLAESGQRTATSCTRTSAR